MEPFDHLKGKLREESPLPEGFGWDDMQKGIFEKMAQTPIPINKPKRFRSWKLIFFLLGMGVTLGLVTLFQIGANQQEVLSNPSKKEVVSIPSPSSLDKITTEQASNRTIENSTEQAVQISVTSLNKVIKANIEDKESIGGNASFIITKKDLLNTKNLSANIQAGLANLNPTKTIIENTPRIDKLQGSEKTPENQEESTLKQTIKTPIKKHIISPTIKEMEQLNSVAPPTAFNNTLSPLKAVINSISTEKEKIIWALTALEKKPFKLLNYLRLSAIKPLPLSQPLAVEKNAQSARFSMALGAGVNYWTPNWENTIISQERAKYEKAFLGNTYAVQLGYQLKPNWAISTGLMWSKNYSKFDYNQVETQQRTKEAALVEIQVNSFTGDSTKIYGDKIINVEQTRRVVHYNSFQKWAIPLTVKYSLRNRKMEYAFGLGTMLTLSTHTSGKTVNPEIIDYNATSPIYKSSFAIGAMGSFDLNYHFSKKYYIGAQLAIVKDLTNWSQTNETVLKPTLFHGQIMIGRKF